MTDSNPWASQWFKAQQQFVDAWSDMAKSGAANNSTGNSTGQADLWAQSFDMWRKASGAQTQPDIQQAMNKCMDMGKEYFAMAEQISKSLSQGKQPIEAINQWMEQLKQSLQQFSAMPGFDGRGVNDFMQQWFSPTQSWQQMASALTPMNQAAWQLPGMNTSVFNMGEAIDPLGRLLEAPGVGYFREPQEKQQKGLQLALEYQQANNAFNQAFLRVALESIQGFQARLMRLGNGEMPKSLRGIYDLWVEVSEEHYAEFAMSEEYQSLYGDMVNRLMVMKKHYNEMTNDLLLAMNLPNTREVDTMQERLQQLRRENVVLKKELGEIRSMLGQRKSKPTAVERAPATKPATVELAPAEKPAAVEPAPAAKPAAVEPAPAAKPAAAATPPATARKKAVKPARSEASSKPAPGAPAKTAAKPAIAKAPAKKAGATKAAAKKESAVTKASTGV